MFVKKIIAQSRALLEALFVLQCGLVIDNQRVTWTAFAILAMFNIQERRRRRAGQLVNDDEVEERLGRDEQEELLGRMAEVENMVQDPNSSVLRDPAALAVVRVPAARLEREDLNEPGPSRSSRQRLKCPVPGCPITRSSQEALDVHTAHRQQP